MRPFRLGHKPERPVNGQASFPECVYNNVKLVIDFGFAVNFPRSVPRIRYRIRPHDKRAGSKLNMRFGRQSVQIVIGHPNSIDRALRHTKAGADRAIRKRFNFVAIEPFHATKRREVAVLLRVARDQSLDPLKVRRHGLGITTDSGWTR